MKIIIELPVLSGDPNEAVKTIQINCAVNALREELRRLGIETGPATIKKPEPGLIRPAGLMPA